MVCSAEQGKEWQDGQAVTGVLYKTSDDQEHVATANLTVVCDGMHSTLRKKLGTPDLKTPSHFVGLKLKGCSLPYSNFGHVVLANPSPLLFYPISSTEVSLQPWHARSAFRPESDAIACALKMLARRSWHD